MVALVALPDLTTFADSARASGRGKPGAPASPTTTSSSPTRERIAHAIPRRLPMSCDRVAAVCELVAEQVDRTYRQRAWSPTDRSRRAAAHPTTEATAVRAA